MRRHRMARVGALAGMAMVAGMACAAIAAATNSSPVCAPPTPGVSCTDGAGRQTPGGGSKVSHAGWPKISGVLRMADDSGRTVLGGALNDELLGAAGSDHLIGGDGRDVLWGDQFVVGNDSHQHDTLSGGPGDDFIYPSHGTNIVRAGAGSDHVIAYYGHGSIDCGPGYDIAQVRENGAYTLHGCEHVVHFCQYGSTANGACKKPGARAVVARRR